MRRTGYLGPVGEEYDFFPRVCPHFHKLEERIGDVLRAYADTSPSSIVRVLEIGCGTGETSGIILRASPRIRLTAIDRSADMVRVARKRVASGIQKTVRFVKADALAFLQKQESDSFDAVASAFTIHNWDSSFRHRVLIQVFRVLKKNGVFVNADKFAHNDPNAHRRSLRWQIRQFDRLERWGRPDLKKDWINHYLRDDEPGIRMVEKDAVAQMKQTGFSKITKRARHRMEAVFEATK